MCKRRTPESPEALGCTRAKRDAGFNVGAWRKRARRDRDARPIAGRDAVAGPVLWHARCRIQVSFFMLKPPGLSLPCRRRHEWRRHGSSTAFLFPCMCRCGDSRRHTLRFPPALCPFPVSSDPRRELRSFAGHATSISVRLISQALCQWASSPYPSSDGRFLRTREQAGGAPDVSCVRRPAARSAMCAIRPNARRISLEPGLGFPAGRVVFVAHLVARAR